MAWGQQINQRILHAIALNRQPGYHFCGNFFDLIFEDVHDGHSTVTIHPHPGFVEYDGTIAPTALAVTADFALATAIRTAADPSARLATVSMHLQFTGEPLKGPLVATGRLEGFFKDATGRLGLSHVQVRANGDLVAFGTGTFMVLPAPAGRVLHPIPWINQRAPQAQTLIDRVAADLTDDERWIVQRAQGALSHAQTHGKDFLSSFLAIESRTTEVGAQATLANGPHVGNRVGHVQGGITMGLALTSAASALPPDWDTSSISASFVSPGEGDVLQAYSEVVHRGRMTAVVHTRILGIEGRIVLEVQTNHAKRSGQ
jgi:acyl-coenzyme A thioesterase PaaI-like protein